MSDFLEQMKNQQPPKIQQQPKNKNKTEQRKKKNL